MSAREPTYASAVATYYGDKTASIIEKYGPGPRIHFHTGLTPGTLVDAPLPVRTEDIRCAMVLGQERLLEHVRARSPVPITGRVLDVGCGLGGGALFWASEPKVESVDAITIEPAHVALVAQLATRAGVGPKVRARRQDAHDVAVGADDRYAHAIAIESSCYLDRPRWLARMGTALSASGTLHIVDCFLAEGAQLPWFDDYWRTRIGTLSEYERALDEVGLAAIGVEDLAPRAWGFWDLSCAWMEGTLAPGARRDAKVAAHRRLQSSLRSGALRYLRITARFHSRSGG